MAEENPVTPSGRRKKEDEEEGLEHVTDAYVRYTYVCFNWHQVLNPWHANAMGPLLHHNALTHPDHPLRLPGEDGITLYLGKSHEGKERLLFSLRQLEYLQYYIHEMRLTDPEWVLRLDGDEIKEAKPRKDEDAESDAARKVQDYGKIGEWVPLPAEFERPEEYASIEPITLISSDALRKCQKECRKQNAAIDRQARLSGLPPAELNREMAMEDNHTPGPGLRRGGQHRLSGPSRNRKDDADRPEGVGWGGFPIPKGAPPSEENDLLPHESQGDNDATTMVQDEFVEKVDEIVKTGLKAELEDLQLKSREKSAYPTFDSARATEDLAPSVSVPEEKVEDKPLGKTFSTDYHYHAQQAFILASMGGLKNATANPSKPEGEDPTPSGPSIEDAIGRSLFFALTLTTWEADEDVVLDAGWSAIWFQEKLVREQETLDDESRFEAMRDEGHFIVQDHLLDKVNGTWKPNYRTDYLFGTSLPIAEKDILQMIQQKLYDLSAKAGGGPIYIILHSIDANRSEYTKLGLKVSKWDTRLKPAGWEFPSYGSPQGVGKYFVIDTAILFAAIEHDDTPPVPTHTDKTLQQIQQLMFGLQADPAQLRCGNAGNDAHYALEVFTAIVAESLDKLRADYNQHLEGLRTEEIPDTASDATVAPPITPMAEIKDEPAFTGSHTGDYEAKANDLDEEDFEDDRIAGVYYTNDEGETIRLE